MSNARPESPIPFIPIGLVLAGIGGALAVLVDNIGVQIGGALIGAFGFVTVQVAVIAVGVEWGMSRTRKSE